ncbi:AMP-binding protein [Flavobacteriales bacterium]|nr:AMP-binding protein [Flavobacteriales bacterium]
MNNIFLIDENTITYDQLIDYVNNRSVCDYSKFELFVLNSLKSLINSKINSFDELLINLVESNKNIQLFSSGTTGKPKVINQSYKNIVRNIKVSNKRKNDVWGMFYSPNRMAGYQVLFQSLLNKNTLVNMFNYDFKDIQNRILAHNVTHLSATPTLYKMILSPDIKYDKVQQVTLGGEGSNTSFLKIINNYFPNAKIKNVYASTEAGSLFASTGELFQIPSHERDKIKVLEDELWIHKSLLGVSSSIEIVNGWFNTGDLVEFVNDFKFKILGRSSNVVNVAGYIVNLESVESKIQNLNSVKICRVYSKVNSILGNILFCELILNDSISLKEVKLNIKNILEKYEVPTKIISVNNLELNENGKIKR